MLSQRRKKISISIKEEGKCKGKRGCARKMLPSRQKTSIVFTGEACEFVDFGAVRGSGNDCVDGSKMVLKPA